MDIQTYVESLRARLAACGYTREQVSRASDGRLSTSWLSKFAAGVRDNPTLATMVALDQALRALEPQDRARITQHERSSQRTPADSGFRIPAHSFLLVPLSLRAFARPGPSRARAFFFHRGAHER